jgi:hypothetical protein
MGPRHQTHASRVSSPLMCTQLRCSWWAFSTLLAACGGAACGVGFLTLFPGWALARAEDATGSLGSCASLRCGEHSACEIFLSSSLPRTLGVRGILTIWLRSRIDCRDRARGRSTQPLQASPLFPKLTVWVVTGTSRADGLELTVWVVEP